MLYVRPERQRNDSAELVVDPRQEELPARHVDRVANRHPSVDRPDCDGLAHAILRSCAKTRFVAASARAMSSAVTCS